jgi:esterase/lipase superfamily enzyme
MIFERRLLQWLAAAFFSMQLNAASAQVPENILPDSRQMTARLVFALQSGNQQLLYNWLDSDLLTRVLSFTGGTGLDPRLSALGPVIAIESNPTSSDVFQNSFTAKVTHANGLVAWTIVLSKVTNRIMWATFQILPGTPSSPSAHPSPSSDVQWGRGPFGMQIPTNRPPNVNSGFGNALGESNSFVRNPGQIFGRPNSVIRNPGQILNGSPPIVVSPVAPPPFDPRVVEFLFATTRKSQTDGNSVTYTGDRSPTINFGVASIRIPEDHKIGRIEVPFNWTVLGFRIVEGSTNENKHFTIRKVVALTSEQWGSIVRAKSPKRALIFVHGFNNSFQDALFRNAQMIWDLQYPGLSVLFSWASGGEGGDYFYDQVSANLARSDFIKVLTLLKYDYEIEEVDVIAHSMGNLVVLDALSNYAQTTNPTRIGELIMAAPDVDQDQFVQMVPQVHKITKGMTLYASSADKALALSRIPARVPRAGDVPAGGPVVLSDLETIDITAVGDEIFGLNHSEFATNRVIMDDIKLILSTGMRPPNSRLSQIRAFPELPAIPKYWRYAP